MARSKRVRERAAALGEDVSVRELMDRSDYEHVEQIRMRCDAVVQNPATAAVSCLAASLTAFINSSFARH